MNNHLKRFIVFFICVLLVHPCLSQDNTQKKIWAYRKTDNPKEIELIYDQQHILNCRLNIETNRAILSFDEATLIISDNAYLKTVDLKNCDKTKPAVYLIPEDDGLLVDFNSKNRIYISLILIGTQPTSYVAYVGKPGARHSIANLPGSYDPKKTMSKMQQEAFNYSDESLSRPKISLNGRYVDPAGDADCSTQSHPGVWDIEKNKKVVFLEGIESLAKCESLFNR